MTLIEELMQLLESVWEEGYTAGSDTEHDHEATESAQKALNSLRSELYGRVDLYGIPDEKAYWVSARVDKELHDWLSGGT